MPVGELDWDGASGGDIHVLRGQSTRDLTTSSLWILSLPDKSEEWARNYLQEHPQVTIDFKPLFTFTAAGGGFVEGHGIRVNTTTGEVHVDPIRPPRPKHNFIIEITVTDPSATPQQFHQAIRVHVHDAVRHVWLTPAQLTVRKPEPGARAPTSYRFTVRAEFDDGVVGDLTDNHDVRWSSTRGGANVEPDGRLKILPGDQPGTQFTITATLPRSLGGATTSAVVSVAPPWSASSPLPTLTFIGGATRPPESVPNVLFISDGFTRNEQQQFERIATSIVHQLRTNRLTRPFDLLADSMNYWRLFVPADHRGLSFRCEVFTYERQGILFADPVPAPLKPPHSGEWGLAHLIYAVGLPVDADTNRTYGELLQEWSDLVGASMPSTIAASVVDSWRELGNRTFIDEVDNFPGMSFGEPPAVAFGLDDLGLHPWRVGRAGLESLFNQLRHSGPPQLASSNLVGSLWIDQNAFAFDNTPLVVVLSAHLGGRAVNHGDHVAMSTFNADFPAQVVRGAQHSRLELVQDPRPVRLGFDSLLEWADNSRLLAHELGHSFGLEDEYAGKNKFSDVNTELAGVSNVQAERDGQDASGRLHGDQIYWNWHRIDRAAVTVADIVARPGSSGFLVSLAPPHVSRFRRSDTVRLRLRAPRQPLRKANQVLVSPSLQVIEVITPNVVVVDSLPGNTVLLADLQDFKPGSLLFVPVPAPESVRSSTYPAAELVAKNIKDHITQTAAPLYRELHDSDDGYVQVPDLGDLTLPSRIHIPRIVGWYEGGAQFYRHGIFHPAGLCMMGNHIADRVEFCAVCRYILVDLIDPARHSEIDRDYDAIYPQR